MLLVAGLAPMKRGNVVAHRDAMLSAFGTTAGFLVGCANCRGFESGPKPYASAYVCPYRAILVSHILLA